MEWGKKNLVKYITMDNFIWENDTDDGNENSDDISCVIMMTRVNIMLDQDDH